MKIITKIIRFWRLPHQSTILKASLLWTQILVCYKMNIWLTMIDWWDHLKNMSLNGFCNWRCLAYWKMLNIWHKFTSQSHKICDIIINTDQYKSTCIWISRDLQRYWNPCIWLVESKSLSEITDKTLHETLISPGTI